MSESPALTSFPAVEALETVPVLKALSRAGRALAEAKGALGRLPNETILLDTLSMQEALASSEIENIVTTQDEAYRGALSIGEVSPQAKEVARYHVALQHGFEALKRQGGISQNTLIDMFRRIKQQEGGYRRGAGTVLRNSAGETIYTPPQDSRQISREMDVLERFIHDPDASDLDPLIKMALIHHRFESIHPFPDGNGRVGRILNVLYLVYSGLLDQPVLYLSRAINRSKGDYYRLLQAVREQGEWEQWVIYMLGIVEITSQDTLNLITGIQRLMAETKVRLRELPKVYSQDLLNHLFRRPYTRPELMAEALGVHYNTANARLKALTDAGIMQRETRGRNVYYINRELMVLLQPESAPG